VKIDWSEPGVPLSAIAHATLLAVSLVAFSAKPFATADEAVPVDIISADEFSAMTKGEKTAKAVEPAPKPRVDKVAEVEQLKPTQGDDPTDVPTPPAKAPEISEPQPAPPLPPVRPPEPVKPEAKAEPEKPAEPPKPEPPKAEAEIPKPPEKPQPPKPPVKPPEPPKEAVEKPKPQELSKQIAQLLEEKKREEPPKPPKPPAKVKAPEPDFTKTQNEIAKLLVSKEKPQAAGSTGAQVQRVASLGTQSGSAPKLSPSMRGALVALLQEQFLSCFKPPPGVEQPMPGAKALIHIEFMGPGGSLAGRPMLRNPSGDPGTRALSEAAVSAISGCAPYRIPEQFAPYFDDWRETIFQVDLSKLYG
jgi:colicin import membrane protein